MTRRAKAVRIFLSTVLQFFGKENLTLIRVFKTAPAVPVELFVQASQKLRFAPEKRCCPRKVEYFL